MKKYLNIIWLVILLACKDEKEPTPSEHLVTGFNFTDRNGSPTGKAGDPNVKINMQVNGNLVSLFTYPNPVSDVVAFPIYSKDSTYLANMRIWIVAAPQGEELKSYNYPTNNQDLINGQPVWEKTIPSSYSNFVHVADLKSLPAGAYRVYVETDKIKLWDNWLKE